MSLSFQLFSQTSSTILERVMNNYTLDVQGYATEEEINIITASVKTDLFHSVNGNLNLKDVEIFKNLQQGLVVAIFKINDQPTKYYSVKGFLSGENFTYEKDLLADVNFRDSRNGTLSLAIDQAEIVINVSNGVGVIEGAEPNSVASRAAVGFCQREINESFKTCYQAEKDEFCDGFWSCLALDTNPQVSILIALACSCKCNCTDAH